MARSWFGDSTSDFVVETAAEAGAPIRYVDGTMTLWDAETAGTQWDDLLVNGDAATEVPVRAGQYRFQGPDGVVTMWAEVDGGDRVQVTALGDVAAQAAASATTAAEAQAAAEAAAASVQRDEPDGVAPLDADSLVPQDNLPGHLDPEALTTSYARRKAMAERARLGTGAWFIKCVSTTDYRFYRDLGGGFYLEQKFCTVAGLPGGFTDVLQLERTAVGKFLLSVDDQAATYVGTWTHGFGAVTDPAYKAESIHVSMNSASTTVLPQGGDLFNTITHLNRRITIPGAGPAGADLITTIGTINAGGTFCNTGSPASTTVTNVVATIWPQWHHSSTAGDTATWVSPGSVTDLGLRIMTLPNGSLQTALVDGANANECSTAQSMVDKTRYAATILTSGGGALSSGAAVVDCHSYDSQYDSLVGIASGLAPGAHTVVLSPTGYTYAGAEGAGTGTRGYDSGFAYGTGVETPLTANAEFFAMDILMPYASAFEYALKPFPAGATHDDFSGNVHGYETQTSLGIIIDGAASTLTAGQTVMVKNSATLTRVTSLRHRDSSSTERAVVVTAYRLSATGLRPRSLVYWKSAITCSIGYLAMFPLGGFEFDRCQFDTSDTVHTLTAADNSYVGQVEGHAVAVWKNGGKYLATIEIPAAEAATRNWSESHKLTVQDRAIAGGDRLVKPYLAIAGSAVAGDVWGSEFELNWARLPEGVSNVVPVTA